MLPEHRQHFNETLRELYYNGAMNFLKKRFSVEFRLGGNDPLLVKSEKSGNSTTVLYRLKRKIPVV